MEFTKEVLEKASKHWNDLEKFRKEKSPMSLSKVDKNRIK